MALRPPRATTLRGTCRGIWTRPWNCYTSARRMFGTCRSLLRTAPYPCPTKPTYHLGEVIRDGRVLMGSPVSSPSFSKLISSGLSIVRVILVELHSIRRRNVGPFKPPYYYSQVRELSFLVSAAALNTSNPDRSFDP